MVFCVVCPLHNDLCGSTAVNSVEMCIRDRYLEAWKVGVKTIYYVRSKALEVEDCESCSS